MTADRTNRYARHLPPSIASDRRLTDVSIRVLATLVLHSTNGVSDKPVPFLADRAECSERGVQYALDRLERLAYIRITRRRLTPKLNDTNLITLIDPRFSTGGGASGGWASSRKENPFYTSLLTGAAIQRPGVDNSTLLDLAIQAAKRLGQAIASEADLWAYVERLRGDIAGRLYEGVWRAGKRQHGLRAALAVLSTAIMAGTGYVREPWTYLLGTLKKPNGACAPEDTLRRLLRPRVNA